MNENQIELDSSEVSSGPTTKVTQQVRFSNRDVLFVDDNMQWLKIMRRWFKDAPYRCHFTQGAFEALEILQDKDIDVVVSDMSMPIMTGGELMKEIQTRYPDIMRVIMSGKFDVMSTIDAINCGHIHHYLVKPFENKEIKLVVYDALRVLEQKEKKQVRDKESRNSTVSRIKTMSLSIHQLNETAEKTHKGVIQIIQNLVFHSADDHARVARSSAILKGICGQLDFNPESARELELAMVFLQLVHGSSRSVQLGGEGQVKFNTIKSEHAELIEEVSDILINLGSPIAGQIVAQFVSFKCDQSLKLDDGGVDVGSALLLLVHDLCILIEEFNMDEQLALIMLEPHNKRYGANLFYEILETFIDQPAQALAG